MLSVLQSVVVVGGWRGPAAMCCMWCAAMQREICLLLQCASMMLAVIVVLSVMQFTPHAIRKCTVTVV